MSQRLLSQLLKRLALWGGLILLLPTWARAAAQLVPNSDSTEWAGSRKVIFHEGYNMTWVFFENSNGFSYAAWDGTSWVNTGVAISTTEAGASVNTMYGSVFHVAESSAVYVITTDPHADSFSPTLNTLYIKRGVLLSTGGISWGALSTQSPAGNVGGAAGDCWAGANVGIGMTGSENQGSPFVQTVCDAGTTPGTITSALGYGGISTTTLNTTGATQFAKDDIAANNEASVGKQYVSIMPVNDNASGWRFVVAQKDRSDNLNSIRVSRWNDDGTTRASEFAYNGGTARVDDYMAISLAAEGYSTSTVHMAALNNAGSLVYNRRIATNGTWLWTTNNTAIAVDAAGGSANGTPFGQPSIAYYKDRGRTVGGVKQNDQVYIVYLSTYGSINYVIGFATATAAGDFKAPTRDWRLAAGGGGGLAPQIPFALQYPDPIPVAYTDSGNVFLDFIIPSTYSAPAIASVSSNSATAPFTTNKYDLILTGSGLFGLQGNVRQPRIGILTSGGQTQTDITVTSTTWSGSASTARASLVVNKITNASGYNVSIINPDGNVSNNHLIKVAAPAVSVASEDGAGHYLSSNGSGGGYDLVLTGTNFEAWPGVSTATVSIYKGGSPNGDITVTSSTWLSQTSMHATIAIGNNISGGTYQVVVNNPDTQTSAAAPTNALTINAPVLNTVFIAGTTNSAGIEPVIPEGTSRPTRQLQLGGTGFENWTTRTASITVTPAGSGVTVSSVTMTAGNSTLFTANILVSTDATAGVYNIAVVNPDGLTSLAKSSTFYVTVPTSTITYPIPANLTLVGGVYYSTGIGSLRGTSSFSPSNTQTTLQATQVKIMRVGDGQFWTQSGGFADPTSGFPSPQSENQWLTVDSNGTTPWLFTGFTNTCVPVTNTNCQADGQSYALFSRARTADNGWAIGTASTTIKIDKSAPETVGITNPIGGSIINAGANQSVSFNSSDSGSKISKVEVYVADTFNTADTSDDSYWTQASSWTAANALTVWLTTDSAHTPNMQPSPPTSPVSGSFTGFSDIKQPSWTDAHKYRISLRATDALNQVTDPAGTEIQFIYDITAPTVTFTVPSISTDTNNPTWLNSIQSLGGVVSDNVTDSLNKCIVFMRVKQFSNNAYLRPGFDTFGSNATQFELGVSTNWIQVTGLPGAWSTGTVTVQWNTTDKYQVDVYIQDKAGNPTGSAGSPAFTGYFKFDPNTPTSSLIFPDIHTSPNAFGGHSLDTIYGRSTDGASESAVKRVEYRIQDNYTGEWWASDTLSPGSTWYTYSTTGKTFIGPLSGGQVGPWNVAGSTVVGTAYSTWESTGVNWGSRNGHPFSIYFRAVDNASNTEGTIHSVDFSFDSSAPVSALTYPANAATFSTQLATLSGTAQDQPTPKGTGLSQIFMTIQKNDGLYWTSNNGWSTSGNAFSQPTVNLYTGVNPSTWTYDLAANGFWSSIGSTDNFKVFVWTQDYVQTSTSSLLASPINAESSTTLKLTFNYDTQAPTSTIQSPTDQIWYSNVSPSNLSAISGIAGDNPAQNSAGVASAAIEIRDETACGLGQCKYFTGSGWQNGQTTVNASGGASWTFNPATLIANLTDGRTYRVRSFATDAALNNISAAAGNVESPPNTTLPQSINANNAVRFFFWDSSGPASVVNLPANQGSAGGGTFTAITGTAIDQPSGANAGFGKTFVAICQGDPCGASTYLSTNSATGHFTASQTWLVASTTAVNGSVYTWTLPINGVLVGEWGSNGTKYHVLVRSSDTVNNLGTAAGSASGVAGDNTSNNLFTYSIPTAGASVVSPDNTAPNWTPDFAETHIFGNTTNATTAQVQIVDCGKDLTCTTANRYWTGQTWASTGGWVNSGFVGVNGFNSGTGGWTMTISSALWNGNDYYTISAQGINGGPGSPTTAVGFIVDSSAPVVTPITPPNKLYLNTLPTLSANVTDIAPGAADPTQSYFTVQQFGANAYWNWSASTFTAPGANTNLTAALVGNLMTYTTDYFQRQSTGAWVSGQKYTVAFFTKDKAGTSNISQTQTFTYEITTPTATLVLPSGAAQINNLSTISGTALDAALAGDGNAKVQVAIWSYFDTAWFDNGGSFGTGGGSPFWLNTSTSANASLWYYTNAGLDSHVDDGHEYLLLARAINVAGSTQTVFDVGVSSLIVRADKVGPSTTFQLPVSPGGSAYQAANIGHTGNGTRFHGTQSDPGSNPSDVSAIEIQLSYLLGPDTYYWNQTATNFSSWTVTASTWWPATPTWFYNTNVVWPTDMSHFVTAKVRGYDLSKAWDGSGNGNQGPTTSAQFYIDIATPTAAITTPVTGATLKTPPTITGTAWDDVTGSSLTSIQIIISSGTGTKSYWNGGSSQWVAGTVTSNTVTLSTTWTYTTAGLGLVPDKDYYIVLQVMDKAGNTFISLPSTFTYDTQPPTVSISTPVEQGYYSSLPIYVSTPFAGSATDGGSDPAGISTVTLTLFDVTFSSYFNGSGWTGSISSVAAQGSANAWTYDNANLSFLDGHEYTLTELASDNATNNNTVTKTFYYDVGKPTSTISFPVIPYLTDLTGINGTAKDQGTNIAKLSTGSVTVAVRKGAGPNTWWNGSDFVGNTPNYGVFTVVNTTTTEPNNPWSVTQNAAYTTFKNFLASGNQYLFITRATDNVGNAEFATGVQPPGGVGVSVLYDTMPAISGINFPEHTKSYVAISSFSGTMDDTLTGSGIQTVQIAVLDKLNNYWRTIGGWTTGGPCTGGGCNPWQNATFVGVASGTWNYNSLSGAFPTSDAQYKLYVRAIDKANLTPPTPSFALSIPAAQVSFTIDFTSPTSAVTSPADHAFLRNGNLNTITGTATEDATVSAGIDQVLYRVERIDAQGNMKYLNITNGQWQSPPGAVGEAFLFSTSRISLVPPMIQWQTLDPVTDLPDGTFVDGYQYSVQSQAQDNSGNLEVNFGTITFIVDASSPVAAVTYPSNGGYVSQTGYVQGTSSDTLVAGKVPSGIAHAKVRISTGGFSSFWDGNNWVGNANTWFDATLSPNTTAWWLVLSPEPWVSNVTFNVESYSVDNASNTQVVYSTVTFTADFTPPISTITVPALATVATALPTISGSASDGPGQLSNVQLSYQAKSGADNGKYWDPGTGLFNSGTEKFKNATTVNTGAGTWNVTGADLPNFPTTLGGITYDIFAQAIDAAGNPTTKPGSPTIYPTQSAYMEFVLQTPPPSTTLTSPPANNTHWQIGNVALAGGSLNATTVQVQLIECGADLNCGAGNDDKFWNGLAWASTSSWPNGGFVGVSDFASNTGTWTLTAGAWTTARKYTIASKGINGGSQETPQSPWTFVIDDAQPSGSVTVPDTRLFINSLPTLSGTADDTPPGAVNTVKFRVIRDADGLLYNWQASTFTASAPPATDLTASPVTGNEWRYTTDYFLIATGTAAWENGRSYTVHEIVTDKAGNPVDVPHAPFTFDIVAATATVTVPQAGMAGISSLPTISGTANDGKAVASVKVAIQKLDAQGFWFDGANDFINDTQTWLPAIFVGVSSGAWTYTHINLNSRLLDNTTYLVLAQAFDVAGNTQTVLNANVSSFTFRIDKGLPTTTINTPPVPGGFYSPANIGEAVPTNTLFSGHASDAGALATGLNLVQVRLSYLLGPDTYYWDQANTKFSSAPITGNTAWQSAAGKVNWQYLTDISWPTDMSHNITFESRAVDKATLGDGTFAPSTGPATSVAFLVDIATPTAAITQPAANALLKTPPTITGTAWDDVTGSSLTAVKIEISSGSSPASYWTGSQWVEGIGGAAWNTVTLSTTWTYTTSGIGLTPDKNYYVRIQAIDRAGNTFTSPHSTFTYDTQIPAVSISSPVDTGHYSSFATYVSTPFGGAASDGGSVPTGISTVTLTLFDVTFSSYFNGTNWTGTTSSVAVQGAAANWSYNSTNLSFIDGHEYSLTALASDNATNSNTASVTFYYDTSKPTSTITFPSIPYLTNLTGINGTAKDQGNNIAKLSTGSVTVAVRQGAGPNTWWNGTDFTGNFPNYGNFTVVNTTTTEPNNPWSVTQNAAYTNFKNALVTGNNYLFITRATDNVGNAEFATGIQPPGGVGVSVLYDSAPPVSGINFPANNGSYQSLSALNGTVDDTASGSGVQTVQIALLDKLNNYWRTVGGWTVGGPCTPPAPCTPWQNATFVGITSGTWSYSSLSGALTSTDSRYRLYVRSIDNATNTATTPSFSAGAPAAPVTFVVDYTTPTSVVTRPANGSFLQAPTITTISGTAAEDNTVSAGLQQVFYRMERLDSVGNIKYRNIANDTWEDAQHPDAGGQLFSFPVSRNTLLASPPTDEWWTFDSVNDLPAGTFADGYQYKVQSQAQDNAGNLEINYTTTTFIVDASSPVASISAPIHQRFYKALTILSGTSTDHQTPVIGGDVVSDVQTVEVQIHDDTGDGTATGNPWWTGAGWTNTVSTLTATLTPSTTYQNWTISGSSVPSWSRGLGDRRSYTISARAIDNATNRRAFNLITSSFTLDTTVPSSTITLPAAPDGQTLNSLTTISGTAADSLSGVQRVDVRLTITAGGANGAPGGDNGDCWNESIKNWSNDCNVFNATSWNGTEWVFISTFQHSGIRSLEFT